jgi:hypothetical protein
MTAQLYLMKTSKLCREDGVLVPYALLGLALLGYLMLRTGPQTVWDQLASA